MDGRERPRVVAVTGDDREWRLERLLDAPVKCDFHGTPLKDAIESLAGQHQIPVVFEESLRSGRQVVLAEFDPFDSSADNLSLGEALQRILSLKGGYYPLVFDVHWDAIHVGWESDMAPYSRVKVYRVDDLLGPGETSEKLAGQLMREIVPAPNYSNDYVKKGVISLGPKWIFARAPTAIHQQIGDALEFKRTGVRPARMVRRDAWLKTFADARG
jgi:hypothetical protein